jgi:hypothetical protein
MRLIDRSRRRGSVLALLVAALLVGLTIDCATIGDNGHEHSPAGSAAFQSTSSVIHGPSPRFVDDGTHPCGPHITHCIVKSVLPGGIGSTAVSQLLVWALAVAAVIALAVAPALSGGVRDPPVAAVPAVGGRVLLTRFCIARR